MIALAPQPRKPVVPDPTAHLTSVVSASRLNCFHSCRLKFYFRYVLELAKPGSAALFVGKAVHAALQRPGARPAGGGRSMMLRPCGRASS